jgi:hypothetical protein
LTQNVTRIRNRHNVIEAFNFVYHSPLAFNFNKRLVFKGWSECLIAGDTRTGKTETIRNLIRHYKAGEFITSGENTSLAGLLGGVQQTHAGRWTLTWGKLCMNDRRAVTIDEMDNLVENKIIGSLSGVRSTGIAEIVKVQTQRTLARTRIVWLSNPLHNKTSDYNWGVDIIKELFGKQQDISRLDFALLCSTEDVSDTLINKPFPENSSIYYTSEMCHNRTMFAWNLKKEDIIFEEGVEDFIFKLANDLGQKYSPDIPLALGAEMRIKIARGAISTLSSGYKIYMTIRLLVLMLTASRQSKKAY